ncbi:hypothetical protein CPIN18021_0946 [Campylobacter pinnipediorum subsp. caledonicus]|uniref:Uncharacterized protein n=1 Tax=Campylobacter pinnipediorum subsp. caledonicus TaxID=1874362 RepID=A0A1S6U7M8_9BACT|nr:hypothetical protein [Campylobacter pinnipediorum]AQW86147.1 hypothetical protein CPIN18020_0944 [Campylobacter pinnipediorum subsp. caledonicus]AQW87754.1 hypothetical protein CPIN18021_0946 [Campylobacter pinnipediorum subsp. caledonicus]OPA72117.1 hypothetical protein BB381_00770 [Campylobacter pinnipediorum subsp. caledonicus]
MSEIRLIPADLTIDFELDKHKNERFFKEFTSITNNEEDQLGAWLKRAKARGETKESDQVLLTLLVELHRKFDELSATIRQESREFLKLNDNDKISGIGFEYFCIENDKFIKDEFYYARIAMPVFPKRTIAIYFKSIDEKTAHIVNMHLDDEESWNSYVTARERVMIRQLRE